MRPKILAMYLPQFHQIPENDKFWGNGFTDWVTVQNAMPFFQGHRQPRIPLNNNYYNLSLKKDVKQQAETAKKYGIYGFGIYHYWFNNEKNLLTKPAEIILKNKDIDTHYFFAWDNISWRRTWSNVSGNDWAPNNDVNFDRSLNSNGILIEYKPGTEEDWKKHFDYVLQYFQDERYIKHEGKPIFIIFHYSHVIHEMCNFWNRLACENGFKGVDFIFRNAVNLSIPKTEHVFYYEPSASSWDMLLNKIYRRVLRQIGLVYGPHYFDYDSVWRKLLSKMEKHPEQRLWPCGFVSYDDTPRRGRKGTIIKNDSPEKFGKYMEKLLTIAHRQKKPFILLVAWNEWSEGAYLEPDTTNKYRYLESLQKAINNIKK